MGDNHDVEHVHGSTTFQQHMSQFFQKISSYFSSKDLKQDCTGTQQNGKGGQSEGPLHGNFDYWKRVPIETSPLNVRGKHYLEDKKKIPIDRTEFELVSLELFELPKEYVHNIGKVREEHVKRLKRELDLEMVFIVHFVIPGKHPMSLAVYFGVPKDSIKPGTPFGDLFEAFLNGDKAFRDDAFKFIPRVVKGNFVVRKAVGTTPAIIGHKMRTAYYKTEDYFEVEIDISSSSVARSILGVAKSYASHLIIDLAFLLEGHKEQHLPESLIGAVRFDHPVVKGVLLPTVTKN